MKKQSHRRQLTYVQFAQAVELVRGTPDHFRNMTQAEVAQELTKLMNVGVGPSIVSALFEASGVERTPARAKAGPGGSLKYARMATSIIKTLRNIGVEEDEIDPALFDLAGMAPRASLPIAE